jgi:serine/threonine protein kinase
MGADLAAEEQFGPYLVYERLGVGGMATVHRALERGIEGFERIVALKRLLPHLAEDASFIKSFVREAKLASLLNHVNVVQIFELGRVGSQYFISMEYIDGRDIRRILRHARKVTGPPPIHVTVGLLLQLCEALDYAHAKSDEEGNPLGLVHRDVSPSNLLVTLAGHLKVIDFGIAKAQSSQLRTQTGRVKGKLAYMAPEAISGKDLDSRSDLFAVGVIAHELLTARPLFASKNEYQTLMKVQRGDIMPPSTFNQACPAELDAIVLKALARDPDERFLDAGELRDELLELRRMYNLQTGHRDVAQWLDWAFSLEPPSGFAATNTFEQSGSGFDMKSAAGSKPLPGARAKSKPRASSNDEEEAVEIAWGGGEREHNSGQPLLLDEVPDFSDKFVGLDPGIVIDPNIAIDSDFLDDIPATGPSHGHPSRPPRDTAPSFAAPLAQAIVTPPPLPPPPVRGMSQPFVDRRRADVPAIPPDGRERRNTAQGTGAMDRVTPPPDGIKPATRPARSLTELAGVAPDTEPSQPAVTFRPAHMPRLESEERPSLRSSKVPSTRPGVQPARASTAGFARVEDFEAPTRTKRASTSSVTIGSSIVARQSVRRGWVYGVALLAIGAVVAGGLWLANREPTAAVALTEPPPKATVKPIGTLKFAIEPADAEIAIEGKTTHVGSPWAIELEPGMYQIRIQHKDYKARLKTVELSPSETMTLDLALEKLGRDASEAKLILGSTPGGLEVVIDGKPLPDRTPVTINVKPGKHSIVMRQNGVEVWRQDVQAQAGVDHEFSPSMTEAKQRERAQRVAGVVPKRLDERDTKTVDQTPGKPPENAKPDDKADPTKPDPTKPPDPKATQPGPFDPKPVTPVTPPIVPPKPPVVAPTPPPAPRGPVNVAPHTVKRLSGDAPTFKKVRNAELPAMVSAKLCIDTAGKITSVDVLTKQLDRATVVDMMSTIRGWRYAPYLQNGSAIAVCFVVPFRLK